MGLIIFYTTSTFNFKVLKGNLSNVILKCIVLMFLCSSFTSSRSTHSLCSGTCTHGVLWRPPSGLHCRHSWCPPWSHRSVSLSALTAGDHGLSLCTQTACMLGKRTWRGDETYFKVNETYERGSNDSPGPTSTLNGLLGTPTPPKVTVTMCGPAWVGR